MGCLIIWLGHVILAYCQSIVGVTFDISINDECAVEKNSEVRTVVNGGVKHFYILCSLFKGVSYVDNLSFI